MRAVAGVAQGSRPTRCGIYTLRFEEFPASPATPKSGCPVSWMERCCHTPSYPAAQHHLPRAATHFHTDRMVRTLIIRPFADRVHACMGDPHLSRDTCAVAPPRGFACVPADRCRLSRECQCSRLRDDGGVPPFLFLAWLALEPPLSCSIWWRWGLSRV